MFCLVQINCSHFEQAMIRSRVCGPGHDMFMRIYETFHRAHSPLFHILLPPAYIGMDGAVTSDLDKCDFGEDDEDLYGH